MERQAKDGTFYKEVGRGNWQVVKRQAKDGTFYKKVGLDEWQALGDIKEQEDNSFLEEAGDYALDKIIDAGRFLDKYTGAPTRQAISEAQHGRSPIEGFSSQFGEDPSKAPTGKQIAQKAGISETSLSDIAPGAFTEDIEKAEDWLSFQKGGPADITASGAAGLGLDIVADPINLIPGAAISKTIAVGGKGIRGATSGLGKGIRGASDVVKSGVKKATINLGHALTGVPKKNISTYIEKTKEVDSLIADYGDDITQAADKLRLDLQKAIRDRIGSLNEDVKLAIKEAPVASLRSNEATIDALEHVKQGINENYYPGAISEIESIVKKVKDSSKFEDETLNQLDTFLKSQGKKVEDVVNNPPDRVIFDAKSANEAKRYLQDMAKGSYFKGGQLFTTSKQASKASRAGARQSRKAEVSIVPKTAKANAQLALIHDLEKVINKNIIAPGRPEGALMSAGAGINNRNIRNLKKIYELTGFDALSEAEKLSSARAFAKPGLLPIDSTGKSATRMAFAGILGSFGGPLSAAAMMLSTSPAALKAGIKAGYITSNSIRKLSGMTGKVTDSMLDVVIKSSKSKKGIAALKSAISLSRVASMDNVKLKGNSKWLNEGFNKLLKSNDKYSGLRSLMIEEPKIKKLLINLSGLKEGSKAFNSSIKKIDKILEEGER